MLHHRPDVKREATRWGDRERGGDKSVGAPQEQGVARVALVIIRRGASQHPQMAKSGALDLSQPAGRRAGANQRPHHEALARKEREQRSLIPLAPGAQGLRQAERSGRERETGASRWDQGATLDCPVEEPPSLSKIDPARLATGERERERERACGEDCTGVGPVRSVNALTS